MADNREATVAYGQYVPIAEYEALKAKCAELEQKLALLTESIRLAQHRRFGRSSERIVCEGQMSLFNEAEVFGDQATAQQEPDSEKIDVAAHKRSARPRLVDTIPEGMPVETVRHEMPEDERVCPCCGGQMHAMGEEEVRSELVLVPASAKVVKHVRVVYSCRHCEKEGTEVPIAKADVEKPVIKGGFASPEAVAEVMTQKYVMGVPLYRQEQNFNREGLALSRQTMANWVILAALSWLLPIYEALHRALCGRDVMHADETVVQVLHEPGKPAQSESRMWMYRTGCDAAVSIILYEYQPDRRYERPKAFLSGFKGYLHSDGYGAYHALPGHIVSVGCWSHARRKYFDAMNALPKKDQEESPARKGVCYCDRLFKIERKLAELDFSERHAKRLELAKPVIDEFYKWLESLGTVSSKSAFGKAVHYSIGQREYLERYLEDGRLEISNNRGLC
jgi:transposase